MMKSQRFLLHKRIKIALIAVFVFSFLIIPEVRAASLRQEGPIYVVQSGDTLNSIALRFGISADDLQSANGITDPNALDIGQQLVIPGLEDISGLLTSETLPIGASLQNLTRQYSLSKNNLIFLNRLTSPSETIAGVSFIIPVNEGQNPLTPLTPIINDQTLLETAIRTGTSPWKMIEHNQLAAAWDILPGETLFDLKEEAQDQPNPLFIQSISLNNLPVIQGETLQIAVLAESAVELAGTFADRELNFFSDDEENYFSFHGIHALTEPGPYSLQITAVLDDGTTQQIDQLVLVEEGGYGNEWVNVPEEYLDETVIIEEDAYLEPILNRVSPDRHWQGQFQYPVDEPCVNSSFGQRRDYNNGGLYFYHTGMDFGVCAQNLNIYAPADGEVVLAEELTIKGKAVLIDHGWGVLSGYWHLSEFNVQTGDFVKTGDLIGQIGNTGRSAGPHLHFEIDVTGTPVNPSTWLEQEFPQPVP